MNEPSSFSIRWVALRLVQREANAAYAAAKKECDTKYRSSPGPVDPLALDAVDYSEMPLDPSCAKKGISVDEALAAHTRRSAFLAAEMARYEVDVVREKRMELLYQLMTAQGHYRFGVREYFEDDLDEDDLNDCEEV